MTQQEAQLPVLQSARAAYDFFLSHWTRALPGAALAALGATAMGLIMRTPPEARGAGATLLALALVFISTVIYQSALYRMALRPEESSRFGLTLGGDEARLAGLYAALTAFMTLIGVVAFTAVLIVMAGVVGFSGDMEAIQAAQNDPAAMAQALGPVGMLLYMICFAGFIALMVWVGVRLALAAPATIAEKRFRMLATWPWTKGSVLRIIAAFILAVLPAALAIGLLQSGFEGAMDGASRAALAIFLFIMNWISAATVGVISAGLYAYLYTGLHTPDAETR